MRLERHKLIYDVIKERYNAGIHKIHPLYLYLAIEYLTDCFRVGEEMLIEKKTFSPWQVLFMSIQFPQFGLEDQIKWKISRVTVSTKASDYEVKSEELKNIPRYKELVEYLQKRYRITKKEVDNANLNIYLDASPRFSEYLNGVLKKYSALYADDLTDLTDSNSYSFEKQLQLFNEYLRVISDVQNIKHFSIGVEDIYNTDKKSSGKYSMNMPSFFLALYYAKCIVISGVNYQFKPGQTRVGDYRMSIGVIDRMGLNSLTVRERLGLPEAKKSIAYSFENKKYTYDRDTHGMIFQLSEGSYDQFDFSRAKTSRKVFETFWTLWKKDNNGEFSREEVCSTYKKIHGEAIQQARVGEIVSNIRRSIINPKTLIKDKLEWRFDPSKKVWLFKILV